MSALTHRIAALEVEVANLKRTLQDYLDSEDEVDQLRRTLNAVRGLVEVAIGDWPSDASDTVSTDVDVSPVGDS